MFCCLNYKFPESEVIGFHLSSLNSVGKEKIKHLIFHLENTSDYTILELYAGETRVLKNMVSAESTQSLKLVPREVFFKYSLLGLLGFTVCFSIPS